MTEISLNNIPNQEFNITLGGVYFRVALRTLSTGYTLADIDGDGAPLIRGVLATANAPLVPYAHLNKGGVFMFYDLSGEYPHYKNFGKSCRLYHLTAEDIETL